MMHPNQNKLLTQRPTSASATPEETVLNAYEVLNADELKWHVALYTATPISNESTHEERGKLKGLFFELRKSPKATCRGFGFIIDIDEKTIAVPAHWDLPEEDYRGYRIRRVQTLTAHATNPSHVTIVGGILREGLKGRLKNYNGSELGPLWQQFNDFCQIPNGDTSDEFCFCRKFQVMPEYLQSGRWVIKVEVHTTVIDGRTFADYYENGEVDTLADMVRRKREGKTTRDNLPPDIHVLYKNGNYPPYKMTAIATPDDILAHGRLTPADQRSRSHGTIACVSYKAAPEPIPLSAIRLIVDTQITQDSHRETILDPSNRLEWYQRLRNALNEFEAHEIPVKLSDDLLVASQFDHLEILPPAIRVKGDYGREIIQDAPSEFSETALSRHARSRSQKIHRNGFLESNPITPLLACPISQFGDAGAKRLEDDLNYLLKTQGHNFRFEDHIIFDKVEDIISAIESKGCDALFAVLPESQYQPYTDHDTHERIKRRITVPSQCIHYDNTLRPRRLSLSREEFHQEFSREAKQVDQRYQLALDNLLVKHHWIPFAPADPFHYNVHVGIDVGGPHNNRVMACIGYGFENPQEGLVFLPKEIHIDTQKVEPIPSGQLFRELNELFQELYNFLVNEVNVQPDFSRVLFFRDGEFRGQGEVWNEIDAIHNLYAELVKNNQIGTDARWTGVELSKRAGNWRLMTHRSSRYTNPLVGQCFFPFENNQEALVCTTGRPYLTQGTAAPLRVRILDVVGQSDRNHVLTDLIWDADMCFTKVDMGMGLPWTLHVADAGALQSARAYKINGITV